VLSGIFHQVIQQKDIPQGLLFCPTVPMMALRLLTLHPYGMIRSLAAGIGYLQKLNRMNNFTNHFCNSNFQSIGATAIQRTVLLYTVYHSIIYKVTIMPQ